MNNSAKNFFKLSFPPINHLLVLFWAHSQDDSSVDEEKRRNYGGVYVGLPADLSNVATGQAPSTHIGERRAQLYMHFQMHL